MSLRTLFTRFWKTAGLLVRLKVFKMTPMCVCVFIFVPYHNVVHFPAVDAGSESAILLTHK